MRNKLLDPIEGPSAWKAAELTADSSWIHHLTDGQIAELDNAVDAINRRGRADAPFAKADFPLPELSAVLDDVMLGVEEGRGVAILRGLPLERYDATSTRTLYWGIALYLGEAISQNSRGELIAEVTDKGNDHDDMNVRGYKTRAELQPHVDSCDMTTLLCVNAAKVGGDSMVTSAMAIYNEVLDKHPEYLDTFYQGWFHDLRGEGVTGRIDEVTENAIPIFCYHAGYLSCAFNSRIMRSAREKLGPPLTQIEDDAIDLILTLARRDDLRYRMQLRPGDIQIINNYTVLHSRSEYVDHEQTDRKRCLLRLWLSFHRQRPMPSGFANRYNTGPHRGVAVGDGARYSF